MIEKILERLEELKEAYSDTTYYVYGLEAAEKIVQKVAKEYGNGWIPCGGCSDCQHKECKHYGKV